MNKIAVISDIHGNILALEQVVNDIKQRNVNWVVNLGDHISGPLWPKETLDFLRQQAWVQIRGNHEQQLINENPAKLGASDLVASQLLEKEDRNWLRTLPANVKIKEEILAFHGSPENDNLYLLETVENGRARLATQNEIKQRLGKIKTPVILCGHSHVPRTGAIAENQIIVNPGSVGLPAYDDEKPEPHIMETGSPHARYAILEKHGGKWKIELIALAYDHTKAAEQARRNGRLDWEIGLQTGFMKI